MKFLCDVHISYKVTKFLNSLGFEVFHVNDLPNKWFSKDAQIAQYADENNFILITKDADFRNSYFLNKTPKKLIKINLGNSSNDELIQILSQHIDAFITLNQKPFFLLELDKDYILVFE